MSAPKTQATGKPDLGLISTGPGTSGAHEISSGTAIVLTWGKPFRYNQTTCLRWGQPQPIFDAECGNAWTSLPRSKQPRRTVELLVVKCTLLARTSPVLCGLG